MNIIDFNSQTFIAIAFLLLVIFGVNKTLNLAIEYEVGKQIEQVLTDAFNEENLSTERLNEILSEELSDIGGLIYPLLKLVVLGVTALIFFNSSNLLVVYGILFIAVVGYFIEGVQNILDILSE